MAPPEGHASDGPPLIECDLPLGRPGLVARNVLTLSGWAASPKGVAGIAVQIGERQWNASYGLDTPGLADRLPGFPDAARAGYSLAIDTSSWAPGPHYVTVAVFDREGGRAAVEGQVDVRPSGAGETAGADRGGLRLSLDRPVVEDGAATVEGPLEVTGWAHADDGVESVVVTLDGTLQYEALRPVVRPDLVSELGRQAAATAGFALRLDAVDCPPGRHALSVIALGADGRSAGVECELTCVASPDPADAGVEWMAEAEPARRREQGEAESDEARMWESRALVAEADAALLRAEADVARRAQESTLRQLRDAEARLSPPPAGAP